MCHAHHPGLALKTLVTCYCKHNSFQKTTMKRLQEMKGILIPQIQMHLDLTTSLLYSLYIIYRKNNIFLQPDRQQHSQVRDSTQRKETRQ
ncbi:hypothetical protein CEXT_788261 [Caerostris extrusa]|uniref:Uncharacterized protein n=1 Tax=Caerostris extrusa TaxID=172846 RepID=A0AAV4Y993_CAEEX|nr:hypothetical protein CEXT_788261 [Caerostris extrusa]